MRKNVGADGGEGIELGTTNTPGEVAGERTGERTAGEHPSWRGTHITIEKKGDAHLEVLSKQSMEGAKVKHPIQ